MIQPLQFTSNSNPYSAFDVSKTTIRTPEPPVLRNVPENDVVSKAPSKKTKKDKTKNVTSEEKATKDTKLKESFYRRAKKKIVASLQGYNNVWHMTKGIFKGAGIGALAVGGTGIVAKNISNAVKQKDSKGAVKAIVSSINGITTDVFKTIQKATGYVAQVLTNSPKETLKKPFKVPKRFFDYMKNGGVKHYKTMGIASIAVGLVAFGVTVAHEKIKANKKNAELEHSTNLGHTR